MNRSQKTITLISLMTIIILVILLSTGLSNLTLKPGQSYYFQSQDGQVGDAVTPTSFFDFGGFWRVLGLLTLWVFLPVSIIYFMISPDARRQVLQRILSTTVTMFALIIVARWISTTRGCSAAQDAVTEVAAEGSGEAVELVYAPPDLPSLRYLGSLLMAVIIVTLVIRIWHRIQSAKPTKFEKIAQEAENAAAEIRAGADLRNTIKRCYFEMSTALQEYRDIQRKVGMTPREFESSLQGMGLPIGNVRRLTHLFEEVRYGSKVLGEPIEREAVDLLNAIVQDCRAHSERVS
jgi:hypothetical protein